MPQNKPPRLRVTAKINHGLRYSRMSDNKIITVDDITDKKYKYKHIRKEMVVSFKERQFKNAIYWGVRYLVNKAKFLLNF